MLYRCYFNRLTLTFEAPTEYEASRLAQKRWGVTEANMHKMQVKPEADAAGTPSTPEALQLKETTTHDQT